MHASWIRHLFDTLGSFLANEYSRLTASSVPWEKRLRFKPKNSILMTSVCPDFRRRFWLGKFTYTWNFSADASLGGHRRHPTWNNFLSMVFIYFIFYPSSNFETFSDSPTQSLASSLGTHRMRRVGPSDPGQHQSRFSSFFSKRVFCEGQSAGLFLLSPSQYVEHQALVSANRAREGGLGALHHTLQKVPCKKIEKEWKMKNETRTK